MTQALKSRRLADTPALIEAVFPAQKVSFEAPKERKANLGQTLTGLGSYWKGRRWISSPASPPWYLNPAPTSPDFMAYSHPTVKTGH